MSEAKSGSLSPPEATQETYKTALQHLHEPLLLVFVKSFQGGLLLSAGGLLSLSVVEGAPDLSPGFQHLVQGLLFPIGLVIIYSVGAELYTGYPMWLSITALQRQGTVWLYASRMVTSWVGDLLGALLFAWLFTYQTKGLAEEPFRSGVIDMIKEDIIDPEWHVIFLKAIPCGFLVTLAMFMGSQNHDGISKALGLHLPFFPECRGKISSYRRVHVPDCSGETVGSAFELGAYFGKALVPITLGNTIGGAIFTGAYSWFVFIECERRGWSAEVKDGQPEAGPLHL